MLAIDYGALFEINAAAFRRGWRTAYPEDDVAKVDVICWPPTRATNNYQQTRDYLLRIGVRELWTLERTSVSNTGGRHKGPVLVGGNWWEHAFWLKKLSGGHSSSRSPRSV